jgi:hypothetical protein
MRLSFWFVMFLVLIMSALGSVANAALVDSNAIGIRAVTGLDYSTDGPMVRASTDQDWRR